MSLSSILTTASAALTNTEYQIALTNQNVANASDPTYTTKSAQIATVTDTVAVSSATTTRAADTYLTAAVNSAATASGYDAAISSALQSYDAALGTVGDGNDLSSLLTTMQSALTSLSASPDSAAAKGVVISSASQLAQAVSGLSSTIQSLRTQANTDIGSTVQEVNDSLDQIAALNSQISSGTAQGADVTNLEDQRDAALQTLSGDMGVSYFTTGDNQVQIYTAAGQALLGGGTVNHLSYTDSSSLGSQSTYPGSISGIMLNGADVTTTLTSGKLGGLIQLRDTTLVNEQQKLDAFATGLISQANAASNAATAYPPPAQLTGDKTVAGTDPFSASGVLRVAVVSSNGAVTSTQDLNLSSYSTVSQLMAGLNGIPGVSASINGSGQLVIAATGSGTGVALADMGASVSPAGVGVSNYFGLNDLFTGSDSTDIAANSTLIANPSALPSGALSTAAGLAPGATALSSADTTLADGLRAALSANIGFPSAGPLSAQTTSLQAYASTVVASAASVVSTASSRADSSSALLSAATTRLQNLTTVNTDQEMALLTSYQQQYQANAQLISAERTLFSTLLTMMS
jgi:flagellar hook-associated protein 1 FlgK